MNTATRWQHGSVVKNPPAKTGDSGEAGLILGQDDPLEQKMATQSSILAWKIPWTEEPGGLQSMGSQELDTIKRLGTGQALIKKSSSYQGLGM